MAERVDGVLLVAGHKWLTAIDPNGTKLWQVGIRWSHLGEPPSLITDAAGTAYIGTIDGLVQIISKGGAVVDTLHLGPRKPYNCPSLLMGPFGELVVTAGANAPEMWVYGG